MAYKIKRKVNWTKEVSELPIYKIKGKLYFRDERLGEYRAVDNPNDRISINEVANADLETPTEEDRKKVYGEDITTTTGKGAMAPTIIVGEPDKEKEIAHPTEIQIGRAHV